MIELAKHHYLLFDGDCGICTYSSDLGKRMDVRKRFKIEPYQLFSEEELGRFGLTYQKCKTKMQVISRKGRVYSGAFGLNYFLFWHFPWTVLVVLTYAIPVLLLLEVAGYALVARNRHRLSRWFGLKACLAKN